jgi:hypothetical protein
VSALDNKSSVYFDTSRPQRTHSESVMRLLTCSSKDLRMQARQTPGL